MNIFLRKHANEIAIVIVLLASAFRLLLIYLGWPQTDSDEGTMGLMAQHIAYQGDHPLVFYGQDYMGTLEAYIAAVFFRLLGPSVFTLRLSVIVLFALFLLSMYLLTSLLFNKPLALFSLLLLGTGSGDVLFRQLEAVGGSPDVSFFGVVILLLTTWLAISTNRAIAYPQQRRFLFYGIWGIVAGLAIWSDPLILPFVGMASLMLFFFCRRELGPLALTFLLFGLLLGLAPELIYKATVPASPDALSLLGPGYHEHDYPTPTTHVIVATPAPQPSLILQIGGALLVSLPIATGANAICPVSPDRAWPVHPDGYTFFCTGVHGLWGIGFCVLGGYAIILATKRLWYLWHRPSGLPQTLEERQQAIIQAARLMVLGSAFGTLLLYTLFPQSALTPWTSSRYLVGMLISIPAVLFPLWNIRPGKPSLYWIGVIKRSSQYAIFPLIVAVFLNGSFSTLNLASAYQIHNQPQYNLVNYLTQQKITHIYTDYWTCDRLAFQSNERIICSVLDNGLQPGLNRYLPYRSIVAADPHASYVFQANSPQDIAFTAKSKHFKVPARRLVAGIYIIYQIDQTDLPLLWARSTN